MIGKQLLSIVRLIRKTYVQSVGKMQGLNITWNSTHVTFWALNGYEIYV